MSNLTYFFPDVTGIPDLKVEDSICPRPGDEVLFENGFFVVKRVEWHLTGMYSGSQFTYIILDKLRE
jgi:hypothetical protein